MRQSKTTLKELTAAYRAVLRYGILCNAVALGLVVTAPAYAERLVLTEESTLTDQTYTGNSVTAVATDTETGTPEDATTANGYLWTSETDRTYQTDENGTKIKGDYQKYTHSITSSIASANDYAAGAAVASSAALTINGGEFFNNIANGALTGQRLKDQYRKQDGWQDWVLESDNGGDKRTISGALGGAVYAGNGLTISGDTSFANNHSDQYGGAIYALGNVDINGASFTNNSANTYGSAIYIDTGGTVAGSIQNATFTGNTGNTIYSKNTKGLTISGSTFANNTNGELIRMGAAGLTLSDSTITGNTGGILTSGGTSGALTALRDLTVEDNHKITTNKSYSNIYLYGRNGKSVVDNSAFTNNTLTDGQGGVMNIFNSGDGPAVVKNSTFTGNQALGSNANGGAIAISNSVSYTGQGNTYTGNHADINGGALSGGAGSPNLITEIGALFDGNSADGNGGAIWFYDNNSYVLNATIVDSDFTNNTAGGQGGAIHNADGGSKQTTLNIVAKDRNVTFSGNTANGVANDIYNTVTLNLSAANGKKISLGGGIDGENGIVNINNNVSYNYYTENNGTFTKNSASVTSPNGEIEILGAVKNQTLNVNAGELHLGSGSSLDNSSVTLASGATINTIDNAINDYSSVITLNNGANIKGDIDFAAGTADKYAAVDGANLTYKMANALGADIQYGQEKAIKVAEGENVTVNKNDANFAWFDTDRGLTLSGGDAGTGTIKVRGQLGGINAAVDYTDDSAQEVAYTLTGNETFDGADNIIENAMFTLTGNTTQQDPGHQLTLGNDLNVGAGSTLSVNNANLAGNGSLINNSTLNIKDSNIAVNVVNNGTLISDPTTYSATVTNNGYASFEDDTFTSTAILKNAGTVDLKGETTFDSGALISGSGTTNLTSGSTTHFATDGTTNTTNVTLASGADFTGTLGGSGTLDTRNGNIDTVSGSVSGGRLYMDANALSGAHDTFTGGASGATVAAINLSNTIGDLKNGYGTNGSVTIDMGATVNDNTEIQGNNYYTQVTANGTSVTFSDKLMNSSSVHNQLGDWGQTTAGHYIGTSTAYDTDTNSYSTTNGTTVGAALTALDNQVYTNAQAIDTINNSDVMNSGIDATKVAQITTNKNNIATLTGRVDTLQGGENVSGSVRNTVKTATTMTRNPGDDEYNNFHDGDSVVRAVTELDRNMGTIHGLVGNANTTTTTTGKDYKGNLAVGTTVEDHLVALDNHIGDMRDFNTTNTYATSTDSVAMNLKALDKAIADQSALALGSANAYTDARIDKLDKDLSAGIASAVALSAVATTGVQKGEVAVSGGYGYHNGQSAAAFGAAMGLSNRWSVNAGAGLSNADVSFRAGTSYKFKLF